MGMSEFFVSFYFQSLFNRFCFKYSRTGGKARLFIIHCVASRTGYSDL